LAKVKVPCPRCDGKGVIPQYFYNRKGICFLCWGSKYIMVKVPKGQTKEEYFQKLREKEVKHLKDHPPKVAMPDKKDHKNPEYFKGAKTKITAEEPKKEEPKTDPAKNKALQEEIKKLEAEVGNMYDHEISKALLQYGPTVQKKYAEDKEYASLLKEAYQVAYDEAKRREQLKKDAEAKSGRNTTYSYDGKGGYTFYNRDDYIEVENGDKGTIVGVSHARKKVKVRYPNGYENEVPVGQIVGVTDKPKPAEPDTPEPDVELSEYEANTVRENMRKAFGNEEVANIRKALEKAEEMVATQSGKKKAINKIIVEELKALIKAKGGDKPTKPAGQEVADIGRFKVLERVHTKTGETFWTVEPKERVSMDEFKKMNAELKELGGFYDRFLKRMRFNDDPTAKLQKLEEGKQADSENDKFNETLNELARKYEKMKSYPDQYSPELVDQLIAEIKAVPEDFEQADSVQYSRSRLLRRAERLKGRLILDRAKGLIAYNTGSIEEVKEMYKQMNEQLGKLPEVHENDLPQYLESGVNLAVDRLIEKETKDANIDDNYMIAPNSSVAELTAFREKIVAKYGDFEPAKDMLKKRLNILDSAIAMRKGYEERKARKREKEKVLEDAKDQYQKTWEKRQAILDKGVQYKDTELGRKVSKLTGGKPVGDKETAIKVGALLREEMKKRVGSWSDSYPEEVKQLKNRKSAITEQIVDLSLERQTLRKRINSIQENGGSKEELKLANERIVEIDRESAGLKAELDDLNVEMEKEIKKSGSNPRERNEKAYLEMMSEIREMGGELEIVKLKGDSGAGQQKKAQNGTKYFPKDWVEMSNQLPVRLLTARGGRAYHMAEKRPSVDREAVRENGILSYKDVVKQNYGELCLTTSDSTSTWVHELGHRMEHTNKRLESIIQDYYQTRTAGQKATWLGSGYAKREVYRKSNNGIPWIETYMGKQYSINRLNPDEKQVRATEILTMGMESAIFNSFVQKDYYKLPYEQRQDLGSQEAYTLMNYDEEYYNLIMGVLAGA
jgi:hypothetical protein